MTYIYIPRAQATIDAVRKWQKYTIFKFTPGENSHLTHTFTSHMIIYR